MLVIVTYTNRKLGQILANNRVRPWLLISGIVFQSNLNLAQKHSPFPKTLKVTYIKNKFLNVESRCIFTKYTLMHYN